MPHTAAGRSGLRLQRDRLATTSPAIASDLDFYAHAAWQLRETARMLREQLKLDAIRPAIVAFDQRVPGLQNYRDATTHALEFGDWAWFDQFVGILRPWGKRYLLARLAQRSGTTRGSVRRGHRIARPDKRQHHRCA